MLELGSEGPPDLVRLSLAGPDQMVVRVRKPYLENSK